MNNRFLRVLFIATMTFVFFFYTRQETGVMPQKVKLKEAEILDKSEQHFKVKKEVFKKISNSVPPVIKDFNFELMIEKIKTSPSKNLNFDQICHEFKMCIREYDELILILTKKRLKLLRNSNKLNPRYIRHIEIMYERRILFEKFNNLNESDKEQDYFSSSAYDQSEKAKDIFKLYLYGKKLSRDDFYQKLKLVEPTHEDLELLEYLDSNPRISDRLESMYLGDNTAIYDSTEWKHLSVLIHELTSHPYLIELLRSDIPTL